LNQRIIVKDLHNRKQHIEADHVGKGKWTGWVIAAKLHSLINVSRTRIALLKYKERFVDHRQQISAVSLSDVVTLPLLTRRANRSLTPSIPFLTAESLTSTRITLRPYWQPVAQFRCPLFLRQ
jgi:hypothetical protein